MKLQALLERDTSTPTSVEYEHQFQGPDGEWDSRMLVITGNLITEYDPYATGDSPSISTFEPTGVTAKDTGEELDLTAFIKSLDQKSYQWIIDQAGENSY